MPIAEVQGGYVHYESAGAGPPLLLLLPHSTGPDGQGPFIEALSARHRVITHAPRGLGKSGPAPVPQPIDSMARDALALMQSLGIPHAHLVCHSTGCGVGQALAAANPARVRSLILVAPWTHGDAFLGMMQNLRIAAAYAMDPECYAHFNAALLFPPRFRRAQQAGFDRIARAAAKDPHDAADIERRLGAIVAFDARPMWPDIACPTLVMSARDDQLMPSWFAEATAAGIVGARLEMLDAGGHMLPETRTDAFVQEVSRFVADVDYRG